MIWAGRNDGAGKTGGLHRLPLLMGALVFGLLLPGCTRRFFRNHADRQVASLLKEKQDDPAWTLDHYDVYPHPQARFADPTNPDRPPMPPDDPGAARLSPRSQIPKRIAAIEGRGYLDLLRQWNAENRAMLGPPASVPAAVVPAVLRLHGGNHQLPTCDPPPVAGLGPLYVEDVDPYLINLEQALDLGVINSREFQGKREELYATALPVAFQRFQFWWLPTATNSTARINSSSESPYGPQNNWTSTTALGVTKLFTTGARLAGQVANTTVLNLGGLGSSTFSQSTATIDLIQPLLRGGGRAVTLEPLTQSERDLVYELRDYVRFQKIFFVGLTAGTNFVQLTDTFADLRTGTGVGYNPTLLRLYQLRNEEQNLKTATQSLVYFQELARGGAVSKLQVDAVEQAQLAAQTSVIQRRRDFGGGLDQLKIQLGLPTDLPLALDDRFLKPLTDQMRRFEAIEADYNKALNDLQGLVLKDPTPKAMRAAILLSLTRSPLVEGIPLAKTIGPQWDEWAKLPAGVLAKKLSALTKERLELEKRREKLELAQQPVPVELERDLARVVLDIDVANLELALQLYQTNPKRLDLFRRVVDRFGLLASEAREQQVARLKGLWPELPPVVVASQDLVASAAHDETMASKLGADIALARRLDLMNQRAQVVDAWRRIAVTANALLGGFSVRYNSEFVTPPTVARPLNFSAARARHQLIFNSELPLIRMQERNDYRLSLINFQRLRRALMLTEDQIVFDVRENIRQLRQEAENYRIQKRALDLAYSQISNSLETFREPQAPGDARETGGHVAALTQQLLNAQTSIPQIQNALLNAWVNYTAVRLLLYLNLESDLRRVESQGVCTYEFLPPCLPAAAEG